MQLVRVGAVYLDPTIQPDSGFYIRLLFLDSSLLPELSPLEKHPSDRIVMVPIHLEKCEPKKKPRAKPEGKKAAASLLLQAKPKCIAKRIMKPPKKYPKGSAGQQWREQVAASQARASAAAAAVLAFAVSAQTDSEAATTATPAPKPTDDGLANESDLECDPFSDIY